MNDILEKGSISVEILKEKTSTTIPLLIYR